METYRHTISKEYGDSETYRSCLCISFSHYGRDVIYTKMPKGSKATPPNLMADKWHTGFKLLSNDIHGGVKRPRIILQNVRGIILLLQNRWHHKSSWWNASYTNFSLVLNLLVTGCRDCTEFKRYTKSVSNTNENSYEMISSSRISLGLWKNVWIENDID